MRPAFFVLAALVLALPAVAQDRIVVEPAAVALTAARDYRQMVVTGYFGGVAHDLTDKAVVRVADSKIARVSEGRLWPVGDGATTATVTVGTQRAMIPITVRNARKPDPVRFVFEAVPLLTKQGCASGSCHGSPHGKGGFSLSLFGYEPGIDRISLTRDGFNRRVNVLEPRESLLLKKPTLLIPHVGGRRLRRGELPFQLLETWIGEGAKVALPTTTCEKIEVSPASGRVLQAPYLSQQLRVLAHFSDGTTRDVTGIATYDSSHPAVAAADAWGRITAKSRGQAAISVRYLDKLVAVPITVVQPVPGFVWKAPAENNRIDQLVNAKLRQLQYLPAETCTDSEFLRRVTLDLTGLLPTAAHTRAFLAEIAPDKRAKVIDRLLASEEYARFWALKQADLLRVSPQRLGEPLAKRFAQWLIATTRENLPFDQVARQILTATGNASTVAPASYYIAIPTAEERTELTAQVFMGSRVECAKCHNHPFEAWTMRDYYQIAAVFARTQAGDGLVERQSTGEGRYPPTGEVLVPWAGKKGTEPTDRRAIFAQWLTQSTNPYFARVEANRLWAELLGRGIVEPVDDFRASNPPANAPLLDYLATTFTQGGYDRKQLLRLICNSQTYQRATRTNRFNETDDALFSHARVRLLTAEQLKDAIGQVAGTLAPTAELESQRAQWERALAARRQAGDSTFATWRADSQKRVVATPLWGDGWYRLGPFAQPVPTIETAPRPREVVALPSGREWEPEPLLRDGREQRIELKDNRELYLTRMIYAEIATTLTVQLKVDDTALAWLNGAPLVDKPWRGGRALTLTLTPGPNHLLVRLHNDGGAASVAFTPGMPLDIAGLPPHALWRLVRQPSVENEAALRALYDGLDPELVRLQRELARLDERADYATQRLYPELSPFTVTFGQPARETACTCERRSAPTLLQALELLNGQTAYRRVQDGAPRLAALDNAALLDQLYLSALSRLPNARERQAATAFLSKATDRNAAVTDLLWTIVNTQEFLFQR